MERLAALFVLTSVFAAAACADDAPGRAASADPADGGSARGGRGGNGASLSSDDVTRISGSGGMASDAGCQRQVDFSVVMLGEAPPFDVVIVADHSDSLSWSRSDLAAGLRDLLSNVRGRAVRFFLLTPTQYGASSAAAVQPISGDGMVEWRDPSTGAAYTAAVTEYSQSCTDASSKSIPCPDPVAARDDFAAHGVWNFKMGDPIAAITAQMTDAQVTEQAAKIEQAILGLPTGGSPHEQPLCTLARYLSQPREKLPAHAVMLVLSDEDDTSLPRDCVATFEGGIKTERVDIQHPCSQDCDLTRFMMTGSATNYHLEATCVFANDRGELNRDLTQPALLTVGATSCVDGSTMPCTPEQRMQVATSCSASYVVDTCTSRCMFRREAYQCYVELPAGSPDACSLPFDYKGARYANLAEYCNKTQPSPSPWQGCHGEGIAVQPFDSQHAYSDTTSVMEGYSNADMVAYAKKTAEAVFGPNASLFEVIGFSPGTSCTLRAGQSYATSLSQLLRPSDHVFPICEPYGPALGGILEFGASLIKNTFQVPVTGGERIESVLVTDADGKERRLATSDYAHDVASGRLTISDSILGARDRSLRVEVVDPCAPIIR